MSGNDIFFWFLCRSFQGNNGTDQRQPEHSERPQQEVLSRLAVKGEGGGPPFCLGISLRGGRKKGREREDWEKRERGESNPPRFALPPYPLPLSTPATHAIRDFFL